MSDLLLYAESENLKLVPITDQDNASCLDVQENQVLCKKNITSNNFIIVKYSIGKYYPGKNTVKIRASFKVDSKVVGCFDSLIEIDLPKPWNVETDYLNYKEFDLNTYRVVPEFETNSSIILSNSSDSCAESSIFVIQYLTFLCFYSII